MTDKTSRLSAVAKPLKSRRGLLAFTLLVLVCSGIVLHALGMAASQQLSRLRQASNTVIAVSSDLNRIGKLVTTKDVDEHEEVKDNPGLEVIREKTTGSRRLDIQAAEKVAAVLEVWSICMVDHKGTIITLSDNMATGLGYTREEVLGQSIFSFAASGGLRKALESGESQVTINGVSFRGYDDAHSFTSKVETEKLRAVALGEDFFLLSIKRAHEGR